MSLFPSNVSLSTSQQQLIQTVHTSSMFGGNSSQTTFTQSQPSTLSLPQNTDSAFGHRGGRGGFGRGGLGARGSRGGRGGRGGGRGGRGGFGSLGDSRPQVFSGGVQSISSIFGSAGGSQHLPVDGGSRVPNPNQPLITQDFSTTRNIGPYQVREEPTLLGLESAARRTGQRSLFDRPSTMQATINSTRNQGGGILNNVNPPNLSTANLTGNGGLFNNRPAEHYAWPFAPPQLSNTSVFTNSVPSTLHSIYSPYSGGLTLPNRGSLSLSTGNSTFTAGRQNLQSLNSNLDQPTQPSQRNQFHRVQGFGGNFSANTVQTLNNRLNPPLINSSTFQPSVSGTGFSILKVSPNSNSVQVLNNNLNPPPLNNTSSTLQPYNFSKNLSGTQTATFSTNHPQIQATPVQQNIAENNNPSQLQNESASEEEEEEYEEEEISEGATTFAEDLQDLMANHQIVAPVNLFSNDTFTQNLVQFLKGFHIKAPRNKVLYRPQQEEPETQINNQAKIVEKEEEPRQNRGIFNGGKEKEVSEQLPSTQGRAFRSVMKTTNKGSERMF